MEHVPGVLAEALPCTRRDWIIELAFTNAVRCRTDWVLLKVLEWFQVKSFDL